MTRAIKIHNFETFTFPPTVTLNSTKRQELYISLAQTIQIHVDITPVLEIGLCFICISRFVCDVYITFHCIYISPSSKLLGSKIYVTCMTIFTVVFNVFFLILKTLVLFLNINKFQNNIIPTICLVRNYIS